MNIINKVKLYLIPHTNNGFRPRILEVGSIMIIIAVVIALKCVSLFLFSQFLGANIFNELSRSDLYTLTNQAREAQHLPDLRANSKLEAAAQLKLADMISQDYFAHTSPSGVQPWTWFDKTNYDYQVAGENLAMDFTSSQQVMTAWLNSPEHRQNIMLPGFTDIGIAVGSGVISGQTRTIVVQEFGGPRVAAVVPPKNQVPKNTNTSATVYRSQPSQPITLAAGAPAASPQVQGVQTNASHGQSYLFLAGLNPLFLLFVLCALAVFLLNLFVAPRIQFADIIARSAVLVGITFLVWVVGDSSLLSLGSHIILPQ